MHYDAKPFNICPGSKADLPPHRPSAPRPRAPAPASERPAPAARRRCQRLAGREREPPSAGELD